MDVLGLGMDRHKNSVVCWSQITLCSVTITLPITGKSSYSFNMEYVELVFQANSKY